MSFGLVGDILRLARSQLSCERHVEGVGCQIKE